MQLQQYRHDGFIEFSRHRPLVGEKIILDQLLGQRTATLHSFPGLQVGQGGSGNSTQVDARMVFEIAIFNSLKTRHQQRRDICDSDQSSIFLLEWIDRGNFRWIETRQIDMPSSPDIADRR